MAKVLFAPSWIIELQDTRTFCKEHLTPLEKQQISMDSCNLQGSGSQPWHRVFLELPEYLL